MGGESRAAWATARAAPGLVFGTAPSSWRAFWKRTRPSSAASGSSNSARARALAASARRRSALQTVTLTDIEACLPLLRENAAGVDGVVVEALDWTEPVPSGVSCDVVIAADCLLPGREGLFAPLATTLAALLAGDAVAVLRLRTALHGLRSLLRPAARRRRLISVFRTTTCIRSTELPRYGCSSFDGPNVKKVIYTLLPREFQSRESTNATAPAWTADTHTHTRSTASAPISHERVAQACRRVSTQA